ncbi:MAG: glycosyltransferase, partial [Bacteroidales bacterium]|nr:glycosyltransferase [Bacteroidales bacterium]
MKYSPVIVVVAFNRPESVERLLFSLKNAQKISNARLIISIDNNAPENYRVKDIADAFHWPFGEKEVIYQKERLGLRQHVLQCGDYAMQYGSVIILEDDLFVSPYFYDYTLQALDYYDRDPHIGGISLYNQTSEDVNDIPFNPINDNSDVYFVKFPSSWGQAWTKKQWEAFRIWYEKNQDISRVPIHDNIINWSAASWKKYFTAYMETTGKYFVFPRVSFTTNFNDPGTHKRKKMNFDGQTQLRLTDVDYRFKILSESYCIYDSY